MEERRRLTPAKIQSKGDSLSKNVGNGALVVMLVKCLNGGHSKLDQPLGDGCERVDVDVDDGAVPAVHLVDVPGAAVLRGDACEGEERREQSAAVRHDGQRGRAELGQSKSTGRAIVTQLGNTGLWPILCTTGTSKPSKAKPARTAALVHEAQ
ncbi:hypothetical protein HDU67_005123 [Dinochytrium kinnereticum]|nr:hypothetical protein HDU67_005123 [Dinochytrium kinnereticum]